MVVRVVPRLLMLFAYGCGVASAAGTVAWLDVRGEWSGLWAAAVGDIVATGVVFAFSRATRNSSIYDPYWSVAPPILVAYWLTSHPTARGYLALGLISLWGLRLTYNFMSHWRGLDHEDWRYVDLQQTTGRWWWPVSFLGVHLVPTLLVFAGCIPLYFATMAEKPLGVWDGLAAFVLLSGTLIEAVADFQLRRFVRAGHPQGTILDEGLWRYSRHPNYFGELLVWLGACLFGVAAGAPWWATAGFLSMVGLFGGVSLPLIERRMAARRDGWEEHVERVSVLVPWFRRG